MLLSKGYTRKRYFSNSDEMSSGIHSRLGCILYTNDQNSKVCIRENSNHECVIDTVGFADLDRTIMALPYEVSEGCVTISDLIYVPASDRCRIDEALSRYVYFRDKTIYSEAMCGSDIPILPLSKTSSPSYAHREWIKESFPVLWRNLQITCSTVDWLWCAERHVGWTIRYQKGSSVYMSEGIGSVRVLFLMLRRLWWYRRVMNRRIKILSGDAFSIQKFSISDKQDTTYDDVYTCTCYLLKQVVDRVPVPMLPAETEQLVHNQRFEAYSDFVKNITIIRVAVRDVDFTRDIYKALVYDAPIPTAKLISQAILYCSKMLTQGALDYVMYKVKEGVGPRIEV